MAVDRRAMFNLRVRYYLDQIRYNPSVDSHEWMDIRRIPFRIPQHLKLNDIAQQELQRININNRTQNNNKTTFTSTIGLSK